MLTVWNNPVTAGKADTQQSRHCHSFLKQGNYPTRDNWKADFSINSYTW